MKKVLLSLVVASSLMFAAGGFTGEKAAGSGGFTGEVANQVTTVKAALEAKDDTKVAISGNILKSLGDEEYEFSDGANTIVIEIDDDDWNGVSVGPDDKVKITGEVDSELLGDNKIDVISIVKE